MTESERPVEDRDEARTREGEPPEPDEGQVPDQQIGRWKDDGGAVMPPQPTT
jgi:hypothetical protein